MFASGGRGLLVLFHSTDDHGLEPFEVHSHTAAVAIDPELVAEEVDLCFGAVDDDVFDAVFVADVIGTAVVPQRSVEGDALVFVQMKDV